MSRTDETKHKILLAAAELFAMKGFEGASVDEIAAHAHVSKGSIFYNFGSKDKLYDELLFFGFDDLHERLDQVPGDLSGEDRVRWLIRAMLVAVRENVNVAKVLAAHIVRMGGDWRVTLLPLRDAQFALFAEPVRQLAGVSQAESMRRASIVFGATLSACLEWLAFEPEEPMENLEASLFACVRGCLEPA